MFKLQISYMEMTNLLPHHQPQCTLQLRQTTCGIHPWVAKCIEVDGGIFEHLLWTWTTLSFSHYNRTEVKLTVNNLSFSVTNDNAFVSVDSNSCISVTIQNWTHVHVNFFFLTMTSQNTDFSSWITLFVCCSVFVVQLGIKYWNSFILPFCVHCSSSLYKTGTAYTAVLESHWLIF